LWFRVVGRRKPQLYWCRTEDGTVITLRNIENRKAHVDLQDSDMHSTRLSDWCRLADSDIELPTRSEVRSRISSAWKKQLRR
jgi:hypothetical protein